jgi:ribosomal protein S18
LDILDIIKENSKRKIKDAKSAIKSSEKAIDLIGKEIQSVDKTHVEELKCESDLLLERIMAASNTVSKEELDVLEKSIVDLQSSVDSVLTEISNIGDVQPLNDNEKAEIEKLMALRKIVLVNEHRDTCFVCDNSLQLGNPLSVDQIDRVLGGIQERLDKLKKRDEIIAHHDSGVRELKRMKAKYGQMLERQAGFTHENKDALQEQYRKVRMEYENANQQLLDSNRVLKLRQQIADNQKIVDDNAELAKHAEQQISEAIKQAQDVFCDRVTKYLPKEQSSEFIMDLSDNHCRIGLKVLGVDCYAVSGAEWVIMVLAIAAAINEDQENVLNVFIPEERAYDPFTLESMMKSLANVQGQVFLTSTITPNTVPDGWEAIERFKIPF